MPRIRGDGRAIKALLIAADSCWGGVAFYRARGRPAFEPEHADLLRAASPYLAEGARRALVLGGPAVPGRSEAGVILLDAHNRVESMNEPARALLGQLLFVGTDAPELLHSLANRTRLAVADANAGVARVRAPTASGAWLTLHGSILQGDADGRIAIVVESTSDADLMALAIDAYGLTERERQVAVLVARAPLHTTDRARALPLPLDRQGLPEDDLRQGRGVEPGRPRRRNPSPVGARRRRTNEPSEPAQRARQVARQRLALA